MFALPTRRDDKRQRPGASNVASPSQPRRSSLGLFVGLIGTFLVVSAALEPYQGWQMPAHGIFAALFSNPVPKPWLTFDFLANILAYVPLGFGFAHFTNKPRFVVVFASLISLVMEVTQTTLPTRHPSLLDWGANTCGAAIGVFLAQQFMRARWLQAQLRRLRETLIPGLRGDYGLTLIACFLFAHLNPGQPLFCSTFFLAASARTEPALAALESVQVALNVVGVGLFADLLARTRRAAAIIMLTTLTLCVASKFLFADFLLKPGSRAEWFSWSVLIGLVAGGGGLSMLFWLRAAKKRVICNICILIALALPVLVPEWLFARAPLRAFDWHYGHLLNFNLLSQTLLRVWPLLASVYLITTAGNIFQDGPLKSKL